MPELDDLDLRLIAALKKDGRAGLAELALILGVTRATVRTRLTRLRESGEIQGFTVLTSADLAESPVRAIMLVAIEGAGLERISGRILAMPAASAVHSTNGRWDVIVDLATDSLRALDETIARIRRLEGVTQSETHLLMTTRRAR
ncbi:MAG: Lrp/AsnC family transcriptional regulator [Paracoccaceae bacterium]